MVVVDTKIPGWGPTLLAKIKELTPKPITTIINTHTHYDHVGTNPDFPATVDIVVHENTKSNMEAMRAVTGVPVEQQTFLNMFKESKGKGPGQADVQGRMTIGSGADQVDLHYFGRGHTNGDAWVVFPALRVMHAGDIFSGKNLPLLDANNGGSGVAIGDTLAKAAATREERRVDHHRPQHGDDAERSRGVRRVQPRIPRGRAGRARKRASRRTRSPPAGRCRRSTRATRRRGRRV